MAFVDDVNRILRDHYGYSGDGHGGIGALPVGDPSTPRRQIILRDLRELLVTMAQTMGDPSALQQIFDQIDDLEDDLNDRGTRFYNSPAEAIERNANLLPGGIQRIYTLENYGVAVRARNTQTDALFATVPYWGVSRRLTTVEALAEEVAARIAAVAAVADAAAAALQRANHTGTQPISTVNGLSAALDGLSQARIDGDEALSDRIDVEEAARTAQGVTLSALIDRSTIGVTGISGTSNAIQAIIPSALGITDIPIGARVSLRGVGVNSGAVTLSINGGPDRDLLDGKGRQLVGGELSNTTPFEARRMNETDYRIISSLTHPADLAAEVALLDAADEVNLRLASMPGQMSAEFHNTDDDPLLAFMDNKGIALGLDSDGFLIERIGAEFHNDDEDISGLLFVDRNGKIISQGSGGGPGPELAERVGDVEVRVDGLEVGLSTQTARVTSVEETADDALALATALQGAASTGVVVYVSVAAGLAATTDEGFFAVSDGGTDYQVLYQRIGTEAEERGRLQSLKSLPTSQVDTGEGRIWQRQGVVQVAQTYSAEFSMVRADIVTSHQSLYARYDALMAEFPHYITVDVVGTDQLGNEIREYTFSPPIPIRQGWAEGDVVAPKVVLLGGIHGHEREALVGYYLLAQQLCRNWRTDEFLGHVRWNCRLVMLPCISPSGIDASERKNHRGVDLNRNFPWNWSTGGTTDPSDTNYRGESPASESETQVVMTLPSRHADAFAWIDHHNNSSFATTGYLLWIGVGLDRPEDRAPALQALRHMEPWARRELAAVGDEQDRCTRITGTSDGTMAAWLAMAQDQRAYLLETAPSGFGSLLDQRRTAFESTRVLVSKILEKAHARALSGEQ